MGIGGSAKFVAAAGNVKSPEDMTTTAVLDERTHLLSRLQAGSQWLTAQHQAWLGNKEDVASDERFSVALDGWGEMERSLRRVYGNGGCIFGSDQRCPQNAPVWCDGCRG